MRLVVGLERAASGQTRSLPRFSKGLLLALQQSFALALERAMRRPARTVRTCQSDGDAQYRSGQLGGLEGQVRRAMRPERSRSPTAWRAQSLDRWRVHGGRHGT